MSLEYRLGIKKIENSSAVIHISYGKQKECIFQEMVSIDRFLSLSFKKDTIYEDINKAELRVAMAKEVWNDTSIHHVVLSISDGLLNEPDDLSNILSNLVRSFFFNIYREKKSSITVTHSGTKEILLVKDIVSMVQKIQAARIMSMLPANEGTPERMVQRIKKLFQKVPKVHARVFSRDMLYRKKFQLIRAVGEGAMNPPCMLVIERMVSPKQPTICILGKGITFDSGGLSLKPYSSIRKMKFDKIGAVNASMALLHLLEDPSLAHINFVGVFPFAENAVSEKSVHPGDVVQSYLGKTVEIIDPDAEGRLILADALGFVHKYHPSLIIDIATLTGHAEKINCWHYGYYYATPDTLKISFEHLTNDIGERMIPMPTWDDYKDILKSSVADLINSPPKCSDAFVAALFLKEFVPPQSDWIHIDVTHEFDGNVPKGNGIRSMISVVREYCAKKK